MAVEYSGIIAGVGGAGIINGVTLILLRRWFGRIDSLEEDLKDVQTEEIATMNEKLKAAELDVDGFRKEVVDDLTEIKRDMVSRKEFSAHADKDIGQIKELAKVAEQVNAASKSTEQLFDRLISVKGDMDQMIGRMENMRAGK